MRPYLTIALLLVASIGAQAARPDYLESGLVPPGLLAALMDRPASILAVSQIAAPSATRLIIGTLATSAPALSPVPQCAAPKPALLSYSGQQHRSGRPNPAIASRITRGP